LRFTLRAVLISSFSFFRAPGGFCFLLLSLRGACCGQLLHFLSSSCLLACLSVFGNTDSFLVGCTLMVDAVAFLVTQLTDAQGDDLHVIHGWFPFGFFFLLLSPGGIAG